MTFPLCGCRCNLIHLLLLPRCVRGTGILRELTLMPTRMCNLMYVMCLLYYEPGGNSSLCVERSPVCYSAHRRHHVAVTCLKRAWFNSPPPQNSTPGIICDWSSRQKCVLFTRTLLKGHFKCVNMWSVQLSIFTFIFKLDIVSVFKSVFHCVCTLVKCTHQS